MTWPGVLPASARLQPGRGPGPHDALLQPAHAPWVGHGASLRPRALVFSRTSCWAMQLVQFPLMAQPIPSPVVINERRIGAPVRRRTRLSFNCLRADDRCIPGFHLFHNSGTKPARGLMKTRLACWETHPDRLVCEPVYTACCTELGDVNLWSGQQVHNNGLRSQYGRRA